MSDITKVDVLVSGAGPTGLFITYLLARQGHSVYCLDPKPGPTDQSRAILLTSRTMEILESKGLAGEFLAEGFVSSGIRMYRKGAVFGHVDALGDTSFPHMTIVMQSKTEEILTRHIKDETDCTVHWSTEFVSYTQDDEKVVSVVLDKTTGQEHKIESRFIVGADGSHSRVRKGNPEFTYEGIAVTTKFFLADLSIHGENIENMMDRMNTFMFESHVMGMIRIYSRREGKDDSHVFRIFGNVEAYNRSEEETPRPTHGLQKEEPPKLEEIQAFVDRVTAPLKFTLSDLIWSSYFRINERITNKYRIKRAFLIGDAAHCHSPAGGQGMNLGLQDADNLAWKLSLVLNGQAADPETLLDSYHIEREPHAASTIKVTSRATQAGITEGFLARNIRETAMSTMMMIPQVREYAFKNVMQLFVTVDGGSKLLGASDKGLIKAGHFLPDSEGLRQRTLEKRTSLIRRLNLHEILIGTTQYTAILVATCPSQAKPRLDLLEKFWIHTRPYPVKRIIVESTWHTHFNQYPLFVLPQEEQDAQTSFYSEERMDSPYSVTSRVGLLPLFPKYFDGPSPCVLVIVRPDLYVAQSKAVYSENDLVSALEYFKTHLLSKPN